MFTLNLIKDRNIKYRRRRVMVGFLGGYILLLCVIIALFASWSLRKYFDGKATTRNLELIEVKLKVAMAASVASNESLPGSSPVYEASLNDVAKSLDATHAAITRRVLWSQKMEALSAAVPEQLNINSISTDMKKVKVEEKKAIVPVSADAAKTGTAPAPEKPKEMKEVTLPTLVIKGSARPGPTQIASANEFVSSLAEKLKGDAKFMDGIAGLEAISINAANAANANTNANIGQKTFELRWPFTL